MTTAMKWYNEAARIWGHVNADDDEAVDAFFLVTFLSLSEQDKSEIIEFLLCNEGLEPPESEEPGKRLPGLTVGDDRGSP